MTRTARSSLTDHCFPAFYACYLLKSVRTPRATATYIGSTPSPPRRIRQHNGVISQGAWKTKHNRPWVMQMIVHGFPSKLAALQFEWAWQHPHISRHLRDTDGKAMFTSSGRFKYLNANVKVARSMVSSHPYDTWPLSVTIFTEEAEKAWLASSKDPAMPPLPLGLAVSKELEGVDGKSGKAGTGRSGPIDVMDTQFTSEHLRKAAAVFTSGRNLQCSVCHDEIVEKDNALSVAMCPKSTCQAVSHLRCLSRLFLATQPSTSSDIIPRGGKCTTCRSYILWGDVIRGCYRRHKGGVVPENDPEEAEDREEGLEDRSSSEEADTQEVERPRAGNKGAARPRSKKPSIRRVPSVSRTASYSTIGRVVIEDDIEHIDLDVVSSSDQEDSGDDLPWARHFAKQQASHQTGNNLDRDASSMPSTAAAAGPVRDNSEQIMQAGFYNSQEARHLHQDTNASSSTMRSKATVARAALVRPTPKPFPGLLSPSQPPRLASDDIFEISD